MKLFQERQLKEAYEYARSGGQALHLFRNPGLWFDAPPCFRGRNEAAHLIDYNIDRLIKTARRLGVRVIKCGRKGRAGQHIDLCGRPLQKAKEEAEHRLLPPACK